jgi:hypothetical protein
VSDARIHHLTALLLEWRAGRAEAMQELLPLVYDELQRIVRRHMAGERPCHVLQARRSSAGVLKLIDIHWIGSRTVPFFAIAAR